MMSSQKPEKVCLNVLFVLIIAYNMVVFEDTCKRGKMCIYEFHVSFKIKDESLFKLEINTKKGACIKISFSQEPLGQKCQYLYYISFTR